MESNYVDLAVKYGQKETTVAVAQKNQTILKGRVSAMLEATKAEIIERQLDVTEAEENLEKATATLTRDVEEWIDSVRDAKSDVKGTQAHLQVAKDALTEYKGYVEFFKRDSAGTEDAAE